MFTLKEVEILDRPGYFGKKRKEKETEYTSLYGKHAWLEGHQVGDLILEDSEAILLYEEAYTRFLSIKPDYVAAAIKFSECYDSDVTNINDGLDYDFSCSPRHYQDVAVRRSLLKLGTYFKGFKDWDHSLYTKDELLHIRGEGTNGFYLMPGKIPFYNKSIILKLEDGVNMPEWIKEGTVEWFWQANKVIYRV